MTTLSHICAQCGKQLAVPERYLGRNLKCPGCGEPFRMPAPEEGATQPIAVSPAEPPAVPASAPAPVFPPGADEPFPTTPTPRPAPPEPVLVVNTVPPPLPEVSESGAVYWRVRRVGVLSVALLSAVTYAALGLIVGVIVAVAAQFAAQMMPFLRGPLAGGLAIVALPVLYGVIGLVGGAIGALIYNLAARLTGGVKLLLE